MAKIEKSTAVGHRSPVVVARSDAADPNLIAAARYGAKMNRKASTAARSTIGTLRYIRKNRNDTIAAQSSRCSHPKMTNSILVQQ